MFMQNCTLMVYLLRTTNKVTALMTGRFLVVAITMHSTVNKRTLFQIVCIYTKLRTSSGFFIKITFFLKNNSFYSYWLCRPQHGSKSVVIHKFKIILETIGDTTIIHSSDKVVILSNAFSTTINYPYLPRLVTTCKKCTF